MKLKIDYYLLKLAKENLIFLLFFIGLISIYIFFMLNFLKKNAEVNMNITKLTQEISDLKKKAELVSYKQEIIKEGIDLKEANNLFTKLIPNEEDYFSVIAALEKISRDTNFLIVNYSINLKSSTKDKLSLTIEGKGDQDAFFKFLKDYRYIGKRLITIDKIDYRSTGFLEVSLIVNFYSGKNNNMLTTASKLTDEEKKLIQTIKEKVSLEETTEEASSSSYPTKSNPF
jgi:hypothetical protein